MSEWKLIWRNYKYISFPPPSPRTGIWKNLWAFPHWVRGWEVGLSTLQNCCWIWIRIKSDLINRDVISADIFSFQPFLVILLVITVLFSASRMVYWAGVIQALLLQRKQPFIHSLEMCLFGAYVQDAVLGKARHPGSRITLSRVAKLLDCWQIPFSLWPSIPRLIQRWALTVDLNHSDSNSSFLSFLLGDHMQVNLGSPGLFPHL